MGSFFMGSSKNRQISEDLMPSKHLHQLVIMILAHFSLM